MYRLIPALCVSLAIPAMAAGGEVYDELGHRIPGTGDRDHRLQEKEALPEGAHTHDGFYLRFGLGAGYTHMKTEQTFNGEKVDASVKGPAGEFQLDMGWAVIENLIIYGRLASNVVQRPTFTLGEAEAESDSDIASGVVGVGGGLVYYLPDANIFFSGGVTYSQLSLQENNKEIAETDFGPVGHIGIGKEWWVSDNWGIGVSLNMLAGSIPEKGADNSWRPISGTLAFSATYN